MTLSVALRLVFTIT